MTLPSADVSFKDDKILSKKKNRGKREDHLNIVAAAAPDWAVKAIIVYVRM